ncbi:hypothetical protein AKJ18_29900, partial [Vibrio xuii]
MLKGLCSILRQSSHLDSKQELQVIEHTQASGQTVPEALIYLNIFDSNELTRQLSNILNLPKTNISHFNYSKLCSQLGLRELITRSYALPLEKSGNVLT